MRLVDSCITQLQAQGPFRTCNESKEEEEARGAGETRFSNPEKMRDLQMVLHGYESSGVMSTGLQVCESLRVKPTKLQEGVAPPWRQPRGKS